MWATRIRYQLQRRPGESAMMALMWLAACIAVLITGAIIYSVVSESLRFFHHVPLSDFLFGLKWSPQTALRADQAGASGAFGMVSLLTGTMMITAIALLVAVPVGLMSAIYLAEYAKPKFRNVAKSVLELLAGIPTVVYGYFAVITVAPFLDSRKPTPVVRRFTIPDFHSWSFFPSTERLPTVRPIASACRILSTRPDA